MAAEHVEHSPEVYPLGQCSFVPQVVPENQLARQGSIDCISLLEAMMTREPQKPCVEAAFESAINSMDYRFLPLKESLHRGGCFGGGTGSRKMRDAESDKKEAGGGPRRRGGRRGRRRR